MFYYDPFYYNYPGTTDAITGVYYFFPFAYYTDPPVGIGMHYWDYGYSDYGWYNENLYYNRFEEGVTLIAGDVSDNDGVNSDLSYQWLIAIPLWHNGMPGGYTVREIEGATTSTYAVPVTGAGTYLVRIRYIDGMNQESIVYSAEQVVTAISNGNGTAGAITSSTAGVFQEGVTLSTGAISGDPDGNGTPTAYQWFNGSTAIDGATSSTYIVAAHGTGTYKVAITYTDGQGFSATVDSAEQVVTAINNGNGTPAAITSSTSGVFQEGVTLTAPAVTGDPDGDAGSPNYSYQWYKDSTLIASATAASYAVPVSGAGTYKVAITYTDAQNYAVTVDSANQVVTAINNGNGTPTAITSSTSGIFQEGVTLTAPQVTGDPDGDAGSPNYSYQWYKDSTLIANATDASYAVPVSGAGAYKVAITYTDAQSFTATVDSANQVVTAINNGNGTPSPSSNSESSPAATPTTTSTTPAATSTPPSQTPATPPTTPVTPNPTQESPVLGIQPQETVTTVALTTPLTLGNLQVTQAVVGTDQKDVITGSDAGEALAGGKGKDQMTGGGGPDAFLFETPGEFGKESRDTVTDFDPDEGDKMMISKEAFEGVNKIRLDVTRGKKDAKNSASSNKTFIYDDKSGVLYFNENGKKDGFGDGGEFVKLLGAPEIGKGDFVLL